MSDRWEGRVCRDITDAEEDYDAYTAEWRVWIKPEGYKDLVEAWIGQRVAKGTRVYFYVSYINANGEKSFGAREHYEETVE